MRLKAFTIYIGNVFECKDKQKRDNKQTKTRFSFSLLQYLIMIKKCNVYGR